MLCNFAQNTRFVQLGLIENLFGYNRHNVVVARVLGIGVMKLYVKFVCLGYIII